MSFDCAKPPASARIKYLPGVKPVKVKLPSAPEVAVFCAPEASGKVTVAPTITAPTSSFPAPRKVIRPCALTSVTDNARTATAKAKYPIRFFMFIINFFSSKFWPRKARRLEAMLPDFKTGNADSKAAQATHSKLRNADAAEHAAKVAVQISRRPAYSALWLLLSHGDHL